MECPIVRNAGRRSTVPAKSSGLRHHAIAVPADRVDEARLFAAVGLDAAAHATDHAVDVGVVDVALCLWPHCLCNLILADDAPAILIEKPEQVKLLDAEWRVQWLAVDIDLARCEVDAQTGFADSDQ